MIDTIANAMGKRSGRKMDPRQQAVSRALTNYSAKRARRGEDLGKPNVPGKTGFATVANKAAAEYGSKEAGDRVAGAVLAKLRARRGG